MAKGDTKTNQYLDIAANGTRADLPAARGCCNTRTQDLIVDVADRIITEEETRAREDAILQGEIDEIKNNPDVYDIVPTYAALQEYDTSGLTDKDIIRVLADETHGGASTYYRWSATTETFTYIGEVGDYYTKTQVDTLLDGKQDELTAGDNITIEDESGALVISATDTTYSDFTGTDGTTAGTAGLVPAPATTDAGKFLKADGTWDTAGGGATYTAGDGINISAQDVISATNTGKAKVLTTDDYNWPTTGTKTAVAPYLLEPGIYFAGSNVSLQIGGSILPGGTFLVGANGGSIKKVLLFGATNGSISSLTLTGINLDSSGTQISKEFINYIEDSLTSSRADISLSAKQGKVLKDLIDSLAIRGAGAPTTTTAGQVGTLYEDTTNGKLYQCTDTTGGSYTWVEVGAGGGPTVVQTAGTSTTDVMSQNAVSRMVFADPSTKQKIRIGDATTASQADAIGIGRYAKATETMAVAIGGSASNGGGAEATGTHAVAIGSGARASGVRSIALGGSSASAHDSIAIGFGAAASSTGQFDIGSSNTSFGYNSSNYRLLTGLYDPQSAHDAATKGYCDNAIINGGTTAPTTATVGAVGTQYTYVDTTGTHTAHLCVCTEIDTTDPSTPVYTWQTLI